MKNEKYAAVLILFAFSMGMILTAATSGCDRNAKTPTTLTPVQTINAVQPLSPAGAL